MSPRALSVLVSAGLSAGAAELTIDDFNDLNPSRNSRNLPIEGSATLTESTTPTFDGSRSQTVTFAPGQWVSTWLTHRGHPTDASSFTHLLLLAKGGAGGEFFTVQFQQQAKPPVVETQAQIVGTEWRWISLPLAMFPGLDKTRLQSVRLVFASSGTIHLDRILLSDRAAAPAAPSYALTWSASTTPFANMNRFYWLTEANKNDIAGAIAATQAMPPGRRAIFSWDVHRSLWTHPADFCINPTTGALTTVRGIWWENGAAEVTGKFTEFFQAYRNAGGQLDTFVLDDEHSDSNWSLGTATTRYDAIEVDPRFPDVRANELEPMGFPQGADLDTVRLWQSGGDNYLIWNEVMDEDRKSALLNGAIFDPLRAEFPNAGMSNYEHQAHSLDWPSRDLNGHRIYQYGDGSRVGTHQAPALYGSMGNLWMTPLDGTNLYWRRSFNAFRYMVNKLRSARLSSPAAVSPWISHKTYSGSIFRDDDNYQELLFHTLLSGVDHILLWNPLTPAGQDPRYWRSEETDQLVSSLLDEFSHFAAAGDRQTLAQTLAGWGDDYLLTGMRVGGRKLWRFTPDTENANLVAWLKFDGQDFDNDSPYYDAYTRLGTVTFTAGEEGDAAQFAGGTSALQLRASDEMVRGDTSFTLACWFKTSQTYTTGDPKIGGRLITLYRNGTGADKVAIGCYGDGTDTLMVTYHNGSQNVLLYPNSHFNDGQWHHLAATYEVGGDQLVLYYDGAPVAAVNAGRITNSGASRATLGTFDSATSTGAFVGAIDQVAIITRSAFGSSAVANLMSNGPDLTRGYTPASTLTRAADPVVFNTAQSTVVFPGGSVVAAPQSNSPAGFWIVQPDRAGLPRVLAAGSGSAPVAEFSATPLTGPGPREVAFTDLSTGVVTSWSWNFGDGTTSTEPSPRHTYTEAGAFTVSLTVQGPGGTDSETKGALVQVDSVPPIIDPPASLALEVLNNGMVRLHYNTDAQVPDTIYYSDDLMQWQPVPGGPHDLGTLTQPVPGVKRRFYRLHR